MECLSQHEGSRIISKADANACQLKLTRKGRINIAFVYPKTRWHPLMRVSTGLTRSTSMLVTKMSYLCKWGLNSSVCASWGGPEMRFYHIIKYTCDIWVIKFNVHVFVDLVKINRDVIFLKWAKIAILKVYGQNHLLVKVRGTKNTI